MGGRGGSPNAGPNAATTPATPAAPAAATTETQILDAYSQLAPSPNGLVSLVRLRAALPGISHEALDAELKRMDRARIIQLDPESNQKALTPEIRRAAVRLGGEDKLFISRIR